MTTHDKIKRLLDRMEREGVTPIDWPEYHEARAAIEADRLRVEDYINDDRDQLRAGIVALKGIIADLEAVLQRRGEPVAWLRNLTDSQPHAVTDLKYRPSNVPESAYVPVYSAPQPAEPIVSDVEAIVRLLERREWAEHVATTPLGQRLETAVTVLVGADPQPSEPVKRKRRYAQSEALGEYGIIPMCDQVDEPAKAPIMTDHAEPLICTIDGYQYFLGPEYVGELDWENAKKWCESLGEGYELPNRHVMLAVSMNDRTAALLAKYSYYWTSTEVDASSAWVQLWDSSSQSYINKSFAYKVRAVRKVKAG